MFVRKRTITLGGYYPGDPSAGKVTAHYQVLESVRVDGRPTHRVVASWRYSPTLAEALREAQEQVDAAEARLAWLAAGVPLQASADLERVIAKLRAEILRRQ